MQASAISVRQLNLYVRSLLEGDSHLADITVFGEISNFKNHYSSGHLYFTIKDSDAAIRCVMFRSNAQRIRFVPKDGMQVVLRGRVSLFEKDGQYQLYAEDMNPLGVGDISAQFEKIKEKLASEGLFDKESKRPIPKYPEKIAVITSETGAAVQDIINIISRRWPIAELILCPVAVQGESAVPEMLNALERVYRLGTADVIIIGRGGGSIEDLWSFNSEELARKIYESPVPVISAVGHETDYTICDFVADLRAPTPSAAAELAVPDINELRKRINNLISSLKTALNGKYNYSNARLLSVLNSSYFKNPQFMMLTSREQTVDRLSDSLYSAFEKNYTYKLSSLSNAAAKLDALSPLKVMARGYAVVEKDGNSVAGVKEIIAGDSVTVRFNDGRLNCTVNSKS